MKPTKKPTLSTSIQTTHRQSLKKLHDQLNKKTLNFVIIKNIFQESAIYYKKCLKNSGSKTKLQYRQPKENNQNKTKRKHYLVQTTIQQVH